MISIDYGTTDHAAVVLDFLYAAFAEHRGNIVPESSVFRQTVDSLRTTIENQTLLLAYHEQEPTKPVGCVLYVPKERGVPQEQGLYFGRLAVHPEYRGHNVAQQLIARVEADALSLNYSMVFLEVRIALTKNIALFERCGYQIASSHAHEGFEEDTYYQMIKRLTT